VLWLIDQKPTEAEIADMAARSKGRTLVVVCNKSDLEIHQNLQISIPDSQFVRISAKTGIGIPQLEEVIYQAADIPALNESDIIVTNARHYDALIRAHESLQRVLDGMENQLSGDLLAEDLRLALDQLSEITGTQITPNEVLENIFKNFCVGK
jgi:tRNA modification GTPase